MNKPEKLCIGTWTWIEAKLRTGTRLWIRTSTLATMDTLNAAGACRWTFNILNSYPQTHQIANKKNRDSL
ncbi:hypothetical protein PHYBLDRAFT_146626 [Phycomyces blakesleeanus NRRL 1555(-)]|uniref:Uncharacterized protein n=1 Tax=Phycomyces blakesleeanus (strain ATCC 8743b / DSM 1359 / FGSC 10004 / NBRC 33097 / NRRL 1555) TaxID=763407 RepID=A0A162PSA7_PHYB8|nr:hypothetical protein PHYBLDRAFT_146626 [Phycomyces blakesleeanus NRRL 1555(-)]OAD72436.1 hypothetical protein PHYBLDRAFT_146626 [Phycomyces blakesleeanus NRRL 1555(-)]|eukprot:XP_018290476.1 hypothetical protein PHYBLDRAFT_146626 [Phycomyces blakesleeanus NRRL 1555(-)]